MLCPRRVGLSLSKLTDAIELRCCVITAHAVPLIVGHPGLDDELRTEIDATDWQAGGYSARAFILFGAGHYGCLTGVYAMTWKGIIPCGYPCGREASIGHDGKNERLHS